jgi:plasmid stabilization system protein ParE
MTLIILGEAEQDFAESIAYYESKEPGLGWRFRNEVAEVVKRILRHPELARLRPKGCGAPTRTSSFHIVTFASRLIRPSYKAGCRHVNR